MLNYSAHIHQNVFCFSQFYVHPKEWINKESTFFTDSSLSEASKVVTGNTDIEFVMKPNDEIVLHWTESLPPNIRVRMTGMDL